MKYKIDIVRIRENKITLNGWVVGKNAKSPVVYSVLDGRKEPVPFKLVSTKRDDVSKIYYDKVVDRDLGFDIQFDYERGKNYYLVIECEGRKARIRYNEELIAKRASVAHKRMEKLRDLCNMETVKVAGDYLKKHGLKALMRKSRAKIKGLDNDYEYAEWYEKTRPTKEELEAQRNQVFEYMPKFSIVVPVFETPDQYLRALIDSILAQTYENFEVCFADGSRAGKNKEKIFREYAKKDARIRYQILGKNLGISGNTNAALAMATGDYIVLCDHDDVLPEHALFENAKAINETGCDCLYSDEDKLDMDGGSLFDPHFKPDFNIDMLCSVNYICHLFVVKKELITQYGEFDPEYDGAQDYDFIFRMTEHAKQIVHIPKVLYHWRCHMNSTASNPESKLYAFTAGEKAIRAHYLRVHPEIAIEKIEKGIDYGIYHTYFKIEKEPLISIIIPNKDHTQDLDVAIRSVYEKGRYKNIEFIVVENNSTQPETTKYYENIQKEFSNVRVVYWDKEFNYSAINNYGVKYAKGEYLLFLNNDVEMINPDSLYEMLGYVQREDVGACGCRLLYEEGSIQHAGVVIGFGGIAGHTFIGRFEEEGSYFHRAMTAQDYSAVTAACLLTKKELFLSVGGFSEELAVAFNDIDLCMKIRQKEKLVVYNPYAVFYHYESKSRGLEDTPEKVERFNREIVTFMKKWPEILKNGDPYYNPNLTLLKSNFALRDLLKEKIGEPYHMEGIEKYL